jgi:hypothetical protein
MQYNFSQAFLRSHTRQKGAKIDVSKAYFSWLKNMILFYNNHILLCLN